MTCISDMVCANVSNPTTFSEVRTAGVRPRKRELLMFLTDLCIEFQRRLLPVYLAYSFTRR